MTNKELRELDKQYNMLIELIEDRLNEEEFEREQEEQDAIVEGILKMVQYDTHGDVLYEVRKLYGLGE